MPIHLLGHLIDTMFSYDGNVMLAALISLLLVIAFVLLLHLYAKWFLAQARRRGSVSHVLGPARFHHFHGFAFDAALSGSTTKGLDASVIASIPLFLYDAEEHKHGLECVICLSAFEDKDIGRSLPRCRHAFHLECIDMWLQSHSSCPICRAPVLCAAGETREPPAEEGPTVLDILVDATENEGSSSNSSSSSSVSVSQSPRRSSSFGCSLKTMLSRSRAEQKVFPASNAEDLCLDA